MNSRNDGRQRISFAAMNRLIRTAELNSAFSQQLTETELIRATGYVYGELEPTEKEAFDAILNKQNDESPLAQYVKQLTAIEEDYRFVMRMMRFIRSLPKSEQ